MGAPAEDFNDIDLRVDVDGDFLVIALVINKKFAPLKAIIEEIT